jgi:septum site-determining protein MinC
VSETPSTPKSSLAVDFKSATLYAVRVVLHSHDMTQLSAALDKRMHDAGSFFQNEPVVVDASLVEAAIDWPSLVTALRDHHLHPVGVVALGDNLQSAKQHGLVAVDLSNPLPRPTSAPVADKDVPIVAPPAADAGDKPAVDEQAAEDASAVPTIPEVAPAAMIINRPLRSGQRIYARNTDLIVIGVVSQGAEVIADGNIHVYGPLRGKAMAGARGDTTARIFTTQLDPELLAIAGVYRVIEAQLDASLHNQPTIVQLEGDNLMIKPLTK